VTGRTCCIGYVIIIIAVVVIIIIIKNVFRNKYATIIMIMSDGSQAIYNPSQDSPSLLCPQLP
jgi:hypothetical protein